MECECALCNLPMEDSTGEGWYVGGRLGLSVYVCKTCYDLLRPLKAAEVLN